MRSGRPCACSTTSTRSVSDRCRWTSAHELCTDIVSTLVDCDVSEEELSRLEPYTTGPLLRAIERHLNLADERRAEIEQGADSPEDYRLDHSTGDLVRIEERPE